jgi:hypothetical protein
MIGMMSRILRDIKNGTTFMAFAKAAHGVETPEKQILPKDVHTVAY